MRPGDPEVTVVIPSRGLAARATLLWRAIDSVRAQRGVVAVPLVVLNGAQRAPEVEGALRAAPGVRLVVRANADLPSAHRAGREGVDTPWFGTLDDDDILLPGALARRVQALEAHPAADVVVTNGLVRAGDRDTLHVPDGNDVVRDPLRALLRQNWLLPGAWLARASRVGPELYDGMPRYRECTFLALRFSTAFTMHWDREPTVVYHLGSPHAESRSWDYVLGQVASVRTLLALPLPAWMRRRLRQEIVAAYHLGADRLWSEGKTGDAWRMHGRTLAAWGGLRHLTFTRHLLAASWRDFMAKAGASRSVLP